MFNKTDETVRNYNGIKYLALVDSEKYCTIFNSTRYLTRIKSGISYIVSRNYAKIKIDSDDDIPLEKTLTLHNAVILIKSVFNQNQN